MNLFDELMSLIRTLESEAIPYALCGGLAVATHGAPRATKDIDLLVPPDEVDRLLQVVSGLGYRFPANPMRFRDGMEMRRTRKIEGGKLMTLDLILVDTQREAAWRSRERRTLGDAHLWVIGRDALIAMKSDAGRPIDVADIERLTEVDR